MYHSDFDKAVKIVSSHRISLKIHSYTIGEALCGKIGKEAKSLLRRKEKRLYKQGKAQIIDGGFWLICPNCEKERHAEIIAKYMKIWKDFTKSATKF